VATGVQAIRTRIKHWLRHRLPQLYARLDWVYLTLASRWPRGADRPLVSVVIAHRDRPLQLHRTVESVLAQGYAKFECLVFDDGSTALALAELETIAREHTRVRLVLMDHHRGLAAARSSGLLEAKGSLVLFVECDDRLVPHALWRLVRAVEERRSSGVWARRVASSGNAGGLAAQWSQTPDLDAGNAANALVLFEAEAARRVGGPVAAWGDIGDVADLAARIITSGDVIAGAGCIGAVAGEAQPVDEIGEVDVLFMPHNAYHTREMASVAAELERRGRRCLFVDITNSYPDEGSGRTMRELGLRHVPYAKDILQRIAPQVLFVMNDWSAIAHEHVIEARSLGVRSMALVEGVQDYEDTHVADTGQGWIRRAYQHADVALVVGEHDLRFFSGRDARLTGSTRIEKLANEPRPTQRTRRVLINSNFTYGVWTGAQRAWIESAVRACELANVEYVISQHHADEMDLSGFSRSNRPLYEELREAGVLVSRFSGVMLEAMALDVPVVYHNPHGERIDKFLDPQGAYPITQDAESLAEAIRASLDTPCDAIIQQQRAFFGRHVSIDPHRASWERIADEIEREIETNTARPE